MITQLSTKRIWNNAQEELITQQIIPSDNEIWINKMELQIEINKFFDELIEAEHNNLSEAEKCGDCDIFINHFCIKHSSVMTFQNGINNAIMRIKRMIKKVDESPQ